MQSVEILGWALRARAQWINAPCIEVLIDGKRILDGNLNAITNSMLEVGLVHCRALLEFLGLGAKQQSLIEISGRRSGDIGIEHFRNIDGPLPKVLPEIALRRYLGETHEAEQALAQVFWLTNKGIAHNTSQFCDDPTNSDLIQVASAGVRAPMISYFYTPLGRWPPNSIVTTRCAAE